MTKNVIITLKILGNTVNTPKSCIVPRITIQSCSSIEEHCNRFSKLTLIPTRCVDNQANGGMYDRTYLLANDDCSHHL